MGSRLFNCYKASCAISGKTEGGALTVSDIVSFLDPPGSRYHFDIPAHLTDWGNAPHAKRWLERYPAAMVAVQRGLVDVLYDPRENRLCFAYSSLGVMGLVGRTLTKGVKPKWRRYDKYRIPCIYNSLCETAVLVEDAVSAASVAATGEYAGCALLGTNVSSGFTSWAKFGRMIVALDKDASLKALEYQKLLSWFKPTDVILLDKDLKCYNTEEIKGQLCTA